MIQLNYIEVPSTLQEDFNKGKTEWNNDFIVSLDEGPYLNVYIAHKKVQVTELIPNTEEYRKRETTQAICIRTPKPVTRESVIAAAERTAYNLYSSEQHAIFTSNMLSKFRKNPNDPEVIEYDNFVDWVKRSLDKIGMTEPGVSAIEAAKKSKLEALRKYDKSSAVNSFSLNGVSDWIEFDRRTSLRGTLQDLKAEGKKKFVLWHHGTQLDMPIDNAISLLRQVEKYAMECLNVTNMHIAEIEKLTTIKEIEEYDFTKGYPEKLKL